MPALPSGALPKIRFHKKFVGPRNIVGFHKIKVTNSTIFSNFVERLHKLSHPRFFSTGQVFRPVPPSFRKSISTSDSTNKIRTFFVEFRFVNSVFANTLLTFDISASWTHEDEHYFLRFSPFECKIWKYCFAISYPREKKLVW